MTLRRTCTLPAASRTALVLLHLVRFACPSRVDEVVLERRPGQAAEGRALFQGRREVYAGQVAQDKEQHSLDLVGKEGDDLVGKDGDILVGKGQENDDLIHKEHGDLVGKDKEDIVRKGNLVGKGKEQDDLVGKEHGDLASTDQDLGDLVDTEKEFSGLGSTTWSDQMLRALSAKYAAHRISLRRALVALRSSKMKDHSAKSNQSMRPENDQVDGMVADMIDGQAAAQDRCPMELAQSQKQLSELHTMIEDLGDDVNATEAQIETSTDTLNDVHEEMSKLAEELQSSLEDCEETRSTYRRQLVALRTQLEEMRRLGRAPSPTPAPTPAPSPEPKRYIDVGRNYGTPYPQNRRASSYCGSGLRYVRHVCGNGAHTWTGTQNVQYGPYSSDSYFASGGHCRTSCNCNNIRIECEQVSMAQLGSTVTHDTDNASATPIHGSLLQAAEDEATTEEDTTIVIGGNAGALGDFTSVQLTATAAPKAHAAAPVGKTRKPMSIADAKDKVAKTKKLAKNLAKCLARSGGGQHGDSTLSALLLEEDEEQSPYVYVRVGSAYGSRYPQNRVVSSYCPAGSPYRRHTCGNGANTWTGSGGVQYGPYTLSNAFLGSGHHCQSQCNCNIIGIECARAVTTTVPPTPAPTTCSSNRTISVKLGGVTGVVAPGRDMISGETINKPCSDINPLYAIGSIALHCDGQGYIDVDLTACRINDGPGEEQCQEEKDVLEEEYEEAYKKITEEISQFEEESNSTACEDTARQRHEERVTPLQKRQEDLSSRLRTETDSLTTYRSRIEDAASTERSLREQIEQIAKRCETMDDAVEDLDKVRDAIHILDLCPGIGQLDFVLPQWVSSWVVLDVLRDLRDAEIDAEMYTMCRGLSSSGGVPRPAETSEIQQRAVDGAPDTNTAAVPLMGTCPGCEGVPDSESGVPHPSGHARICWDPESTLNDQGKRRNCGSGRKAIMCVIDRHQ